jgi:hypothetical protein
MKKRENGREKKEVKQKLHTKSFIFISLISHRGLFSKAMTTKSGAIDSLGVIV